MIDQKTTEDQRSSLTEAMSVVPDPHPHNQAPRNAPLELVWFAIRRRNEDRILFPAGRLSRQRVPGGLRLVARILPIGQKYIQDRQYLDKRTHVALDSVSPTKSCLRRRFGRFVRGHGHDGI
jgi:hypothetical protein